MSTNAIKETQKKESPQQENIMHGRCMSKLLLAQKSNRRVQYPKSITLESKDGISHKIKTF